MCSPTCMNRLFINLKVLSQVQPGQKVYTTEDYLILDEGISLKQTLSRWWFDESRERSLKKIQEVVRSAIYCGQNAINSELMMQRDSEMGIHEKVEIRHWESSRDKYLQMDNISLLVSLSKEMEGAIQGLKSVKNTYENDATLNAKIDLEIELLERHVEKFRTFVKM